MSYRRASGGDEFGVVDGLVQLSFLIQMVLSEVAAGYALTVAQMRLMGILRGREPAMLELARFMSLDKSSVSGLIDRAERRGLVERTALPSDGRVVRVRLTLEGQRLAVVVAEEVGRQIGAVVGNLPEAGRGELATLVSRMLFAEAERRGIDLSERAGGSGE